MPITLDGPASSALAARSRGVHWLIELDFTSGTLAYTTAPIDVTSGGVTYRGVSNLADVSSLSESEDSSDTKLTLGFTVVNQAVLAATLGIIESYRGRAARLYLQLFDDTFTPVGTKVLRWSGYMDKVAVNRTRSATSGGESLGRIELQCSRAGLARARNFKGLRLTNAQQQQRFPGDTGLRYVQTLLEQPSVWLSKRFLTQQ